MGSSMQDIVVAGMIHNVMSSSSLGRGSQTKG
jgi:hypothetical protein